MPEILYDDAMPEIAARANTYTFHQCIDADDALWEPLRVARAAQTGFRIAVFCEAAIREALPAIEPTIEPALGELWRNQSETIRLRCFALPGDLRPRIAYYAAGLHLQLTGIRRPRSVLLCTVIRRKQERAGLVVP